MENNCLFCDSQLMKSRMVLSGRYWFMIMDNFPVGRGHALIILNRHCPDIFNLALQEWKELQYFIDHAKEYLDEKFNPDGYNIGVNCGETAGQTVFHLYIHLIPRYGGDVENPRGGIRNFKKPLVVSYATN